MEDKIEFSEDIKVSLEGQTVTLAKGDKSESKAFRCKDMDFELDGNSLVLRGHNDKKRTNSIIRTVRKHVENLVLGLNQGYEYQMKIVFSHFPMNISVSGSEVVINNFTGEKKPRKSKIVGPNTKVEVKGKDIIIKGSNNEHCGQTAANLEKATKVRKKDHRIFQDGIYPVSKGPIEAKESA